MQTQKRKTGTSCPPISIVPLSALRPTSKPTTEWRMHAGIAPSIRDINKQKQKKKNKEKWGGGKKEETETGDTSNDWYKKTQKGKNNIGQRNRLPQPAQHDRWQGGDATNTTNHQGEWERERENEHQKEL